MADNSNDSSSEFDRARRRMTMKRCARRKRPERMFTGSLGRTVIRTGGGYSGARDDTLKLSGIVELLRRQRRRVNREGSNGGATAAETIRSLIGDVVLRPGLK